MKRGMLLGGALLIAAASFAVGAETTKSLASTYDSLADSILGVKRAERSLVITMLDLHHQAAHRAWEAKNFDEAAAQMALFAAEGDNTIGGIRKRLLEGGHHHNAEGEAKGLYEPGFVIVTKEAKRQILECSARIQNAKHEKEKQAAWDDFQKIAVPLITEGK